MTRKPFAIALLLATTALAGIAQAAPEITRIELGQAGIARYTLLAQPDGNRLSFEVPQAHSDDVLASLIVLDPDGGVVDLQTETPGSTDAALAQSPFRHGMPTTTHDLLRALTGEQVAITTVRGTVEGRVLSTGQIQTVESDHNITRYTALLLGAEGVAEIVLTPGARVTFSQDSAERLALAMDAGRIRDDTRLFDLTLEADTAREIGLSYVTEAAAWKNSWRLLLDEGRLQGWATLENVSGKDWEDVALTLTTGAPVAYRRELINPLYIARNAPPAGPVPLEMVADGMTGLMSLSVAGNGYASAMVLEEERGASGTVLAGEVVNASGILRYALPGTVDLKDGRTANLMYLDMPIEPEIRELYRPDQASGVVLLAASIEPDQALASGLVSVQDGDGFVGDAPFDGMLAGQKRLLPFAAASGSAVEHDVDDRFRIAGVVLNEGVLTVDFVNTRTTKYATDLPEQAALFSVEHPSGFGRFDSANGSVEKGDGFVRVTVPVEEGAGQVTVVERRTDHRQVTLGSDSFAAMMLQIQSGQLEADPALADAFAASFALIQKQDEIEKRTAALKVRRGELVDEQKRLRQNLDAVKQEALRNRYLSALDRTETEIGQIFDMLEVLGTETETLNAAFAEIFAVL